MYICIVKHLNPTIMNRMKSTAVVIGIAIVIVLLALNEQRKSNERLADTQAAIQRLSDAIDKNGVQ